MEEVVLGIIIHAGNAKSKLYEALSSAKENDFKKADELLEEANQEISMLLIHSQDHLMTCMSEKSLIKEIIDLRKEMNK